MCRLLSRNRRGGEPGIGFVLHKKVRIFCGLWRIVEGFGQEAGDLALRQAQDREAQDSFFAGAQDSRFWGVRGDGWPFRAGKHSVLTC